MVTCFYFLFKPAQGSVSLNKIIVKQCDNFSLVMQLLLFVKSLCYIAGLLFIVLMGLTLICQYTFDLCCNDKQFFYSYHETILMTN